MADALVQAPSAPVQIVIGADWPAAFSFDALPAPLGSIATGIRFELRHEPEDPLPFYTASLGSGIAVTGDASATITIPKAVTASWAPQRARWELWVDFTTGETYRTEWGVANIEGRQAT